MQFSLSQAGKGTIAAQRMLAIPVDVRQTQVESAFWVKCQMQRAGDDGQIGVHALWVDSSGTAIQSDPVFTVEEAQERTFVAKHFEEPATASILKIAVVFHNSSGTVLLDDLILPRWTLPYDCGE